MFRTIMSYACGSAVRVNYFSNPNLLYAGQPLGVDDAVDPANAADNARAINLNAGIAAAFRASVAPEIPSAPTDLAAVAPTHLPPRVNAGCPRGRVPPCYSCVYERRAAA